ncbi:sensor histidine kinase [Halovenus marina]|uniref:sensor histidine kinase n=1 Tax=Halovenus marina TaxID=3396621 RepID=UPI003F557EA1
MPIAGELIRLAYIGVFSLTALVCFAAIARARSQITDTDTQWGLISLLATCGLWSSFHVGRMVAPLPELKLTFYILGLTVGLASVGSWLYFCSAYAGESYHRQKFYRRLALGVFSIILIIKWTSPVHGHYFSTSTAATPFSHLVIRFGVLHWIVTGFAYSLSAIGFYILFDLFQDSNYATKRLSGLVGLAGLPVIFDLVAYSNSDIFLTMNYEPIGVGLFAIGVLYVIDGRFVAVQRFGREQLLDELNEGVILLDEENLIQDANIVAKEMFPSLENSIGSALEDSVPELSTYLPANSEIVSFSESNLSNYYLLSSKQLTVGQTAVGQILVLADVTQVERIRRKLEQQNSQFDDFAEAITHELRNTVNIITQYTELTQQAIDSDAESQLSGNLTTIMETTDRMEQIITNLTMLSQYGRPIEQTTTVDVTSEAKRAFNSVTNGGQSLEISVDETIEANEVQTGLLFENIFRFLIENGADQITVMQTDNQFVVSDNGTSLKGMNEQRLLAYGEAVPDAKRGMILPIVKTLAGAQGWDVAVDTSYEDGSRLTIDYLH